MYYQIWNGIFVKAQIAPNLPLTTHTNFQKDYSKQEECLGCNDLSLLKNLILLRIFLEILSSKYLHKIFYAAKVCVAQGCPILCPLRSFGPLPQPPLEAIHLFSEDLFPNISVCIGKWIYFTGHWKSMLCIFVASSSWHILILNRYWAISNLLLLVFEHQWPIH